MVIVCLDTMVHISSLYAFSSNFNLPFLSLNQELKTGISFTGAIISNSVTLKPFLLIQEMHSQQILSNHLSYIQILLVTV